MFGWHEAYGPKASVPLGQRLQIRQTLHHFQERMSALGYDTFLIHGRPPQPRRPARVTLVPVHGPFWHPDYEICFDRQRWYGTYDSWCWNDLLVVRRCNSCVMHMLRRMLHVKRDPFPSCTCL